MRKGTLSAGRSWRKKVERSGSMGTVMFEMQLEGLGELAGWFMREGVARSVGSLWRLVCIEAE
jgi:hypothetical protein